MANSLSNRITQAEALSTANATFAQYDALSDVYDQIRSHAQAGDFTFDATVPTEHVSFINSELTNDGFTTVIADNIITITWGTAP